MRKGSKSSWFFALVSPLCRFLCFFFSVHKTTLWRCRKPHWRPRVYRLSAFVFSCWVIHRCVSLEHICDGAGELVDLGAQQRCANIVTITHSSPKAPVYPGSEGKILLERRRSRVLGSIFRYSFRYSINGRSMSCGGSNPMSKSAVAAMLLSRLCFNSTSLNASGIDGV